VPPRVEIVSADDWRALPDAQRHHELVAGHLTLKPSPDLRFDLIVSDLARALRGVVSSAEEGGRVVSRTGFAVSGPDEDQTVLVPALAFISAERLAREPLIAASPSGTHTSGLLRVAPDLVVEVASPSSESLTLRSGCCYGTRRACGWCGSSGRREGRSPSGRSAPRARAPARARARWKQRTGVIHGR
jgi:Uma2 family endonuclease